MTHDITFCANADKCPVKDTCRRAHPPVDGEWLSFAAFYSPNKCDAYLPVWEPK